MTLYFIGLGLYDHKDITLRGLQALQSCKKVYLESYTSMLHTSKENLEKEFGVKITIADREMVESSTDTIIAQAQKENVAFLVVGDIFSATTHLDIYLQAKKKQIQTMCIHNASILTAIGISGLELYKFGKTTSIPFSTENWRPTTAYDVLSNNLSLGYHTLCLLDIKMKEPKHLHKEKTTRQLNTVDKKVITGKDEKNNNRSPVDRHLGPTTSNQPHTNNNQQEYLPPRFMTINEGIKELLRIEEEQKKRIFTKDTLCIGCARLGSPSPFIVAAKASELLKIDFGEPLHSLIVPGKLHFMEEEALKYYNLSTK